MPKTETQPEVSAEQVATENQSYREYLRTHGYTFQSDPLLVALSNFSYAANALRAAWDELQMLPDIHHPILSSESYPFGELFPEVSDTIQTWTDNAKLRAEEAAAESVEVHHG